MYMSGQLGNFTMQCYSDDLRLLLPFPGLCPTTPGDIIMTR